MQKWIIVPEGLSATKENHHTQPSFVYKAVLDWVITHCKSDDIVYLAPANCFGGPLAEDEVAEQYFHQANVKFKIISIKDLIRDTYIDTYGNAAILKNKLPNEDFSNSYLVCGKYHQLRSYICFRFHGFGIEKVIGIEYEKNKHSPIVPRLFFYQNTILHIIYEFVAIQRDLIRIIYNKFTKKS